MNKIYRVLFFAFWAFTSCGVGSLYASDVVISKTSVDKISVLFDMARYSSADEAIGAFNAAYKAGDDVCPVLDYLGNQAHKVSSPFKLYDFTLMGWFEKKIHVWNPFVQDDGFGIEVSRPSENKDVWRIHIEHSGCKLVKAKFRLQYNDKNFAARGIPFRFEYFEDTYLVGNVAAEKALASIIIGGQDSLEEFQKVMKGAGVVMPIHAESQGKRKHLGGGFYGYSYKIWYYPPGRNVNKCAPWNIGIYVDDNKMIFKRQGGPRVSVLPPFCHSL